MDRSVDPNLQSGSNRFTKKAGTEGMNLFTKKSMQEGLGTMDNAFKKKGMMESTPQIQENPKLDELLLPATPRQ